jgi:hypothetical protein
MGLFIQQNDNRSQLQERLAAELREKARARAGGSEPIDQTTNSNYLKNTEVTSSRAWIWLVVLGVLILAFIVFMLNS